MIHGTEEDTNTQKTGEFSDDEKKRLLEDAQGDRSSSGFVDDDELSDQSYELCTIMHTLNVDLFQPSTKNRTRPVERRK
ncbi:hypothetical protein TELCIR_11638 [Teladorsagia circumcincta]|uniref:Uncharacterized protein n=1 Tax=Teladorsagia circumcincta TaxID=45464 RepID=A0A2G9U8R6_TELCI|nr:hypothetical protein TELCIR_11638 [Teladorsagia circumcincta]